jgi:hypothetical protein
MTTVLYAVIEPTPDQMHVCLAGHFPGHGRPADAVGW